MTTEPNKNHGACKLRFPLKKHQLTNLDEVMAPNKVRPKFYPARFFSQVVTNRFMLPCILPHFDVFCDLLLNSNMESTNNVSGVTYASVLQ